MSHFPFFPDRYLSISSCISFSVISPYFAIFTSISFQSDLISFCISGSVSFLRTIASFTPYTSSLERGSSPSLFLKCIGMTTCPLSLTLVISTSSSVVYLLIGIIFLLSYYHKYVTIGWSGAGNSFTACRDLSLPDQNHIYQVFLASSRFDWNYSMRVIFDEYPASTNIQLKVL